MVDFTPADWSRCVAIARRCGGGQPLDRDAAEDLLVGALIRARRTRIAWDQLTVALVRTFLRFEWLATRRHRQLERDKFAAPDRAAEALAEAVAPLPSDFAVASEPSVPTLPALDPARLAADPQAMLVLRMQGFAWSDLARQTGIVAATLRQRCSRWRTALRARTQPRLATRLQPPQPLRAFA